MRSPADSEQCYRVLSDYVQGVKRSGLRFATAQEVLQLYRGPIPPPIPRKDAADFLKQRITFRQTADGEWSAADLLLAVLNIQPQVVDGPVARGITTYRESSIPIALFKRSKADAVSYINTFHRLPSEVFVGAETLSLADFAATVSASRDNDAVVQVRYGTTEFQKYFSDDPLGSFDWPIHPKWFSAPRLLDLARLEGWTLKPAHFR